MSFRIKFFHKESHIFSLLLTFLTLIHLYAMRWNVDVYHEGLFPGSIKISQGGILFRDIYNQYGFLQSYITAIPVELFGIKLLWSRIIGVLIKLFITIVAYKLLKKITNTNLAISVSLLWYTTSPTWVMLNFDNAGSGIAWPTHFALLSALYGIYLFKVSDENSFENPKYIFASGAFVAISWGGRLEFLLSWSLILLALVFIAFSKNNKRFEFKHVLTWLAGSLTVFVFFFSYFARNGALYDWLQQTILQWFSNPPQQPKYTIFWMGAHLITFIFLSALFTSLLFLNHLLAHRMKNISLSIMGTFLLFFAVACLGIVFKDTELGGKNLGIWFFDATSRAILSYADFIIGLAVVLVAYSILKSLKSNLGMTSFVNENNEFRFIMWVFCFSLFALFHIVYADYLSMVILPFIVLIIIELKNSKINSNIFIDKAMGAFQSTCIALIVISILLFSIRSIALPETPYRTPILAGLVDQDSNRAKEIDATFAAVQKHGSLGHTWMFCIDGLYSANIEGYLGADKWEMNLLPEKWMAPRILLPKSGDTLVVCNLSKSEQDLFDEQLRSKRFLLIDTKTQVQIYRVK